MFAIQTFHRMNCLAYSLADNANVDTAPSVTSLRLTTQCTQLLKGLAAFMSREVWR